MSTALSVVASSTGNEAGAPRRLPARLFTRDQAAPAAGKPRRRAACLGVLLALLLVAAIGVLVPGLVPAIPDGSIDLLGHGDWSLPQGGTSSVLKLVCNTLVALFCASVLVLLIISQVALLLVMVMGILLLLPERVAASRRPEGAVVPQRDKSAMRFGQGAR